MTEKTAGEGLGVVPEQAAVLGDVKLLGRG